MERVPWNVGQGWGCRGGWFEGVRGRERGDATKHAFWRVEGSVHYFNDIHQGSLLLVKLI